MKKSLSLLALLLIPCLLCSACGKVEKPATTTAELTTDPAGITVNELKYDPSDVKVRHVEVEPETEFALTADAVETIVSIWNDAKWEPQITKTAYDYVLSFLTRVYGIPPFTGFSMIGPINVM